MEDNQEVNPGGRPRSFKTKAELIKSFRLFCEWIIEKGFPVTPIKMEFVLWYGKTHVGVTRQTVYNALNIYYPEAKAEIMEMVSEVCVAGAAAGKYQPTIMIFALKNWCKWTDRQDIGVGQSEDNKPMEVNITVVK